MSKIEQLKNELSAAHQRALEENDQVALHHIEAALDFAHKVEGQLSALASWALEVKANPNIDKNWP